MPSPPTTRRARWRYALKLASWPKLFVPALLGQALGVAAGGELHWAPLVVGLAFTAFDTVYIVLLNDWGDREVDAIKRRMFPEGCSPKTIPDGVLSATAVLGGGVGAGVVAIGVALGAEATLHRPGLALGALGCLGIFVAYTLPPLRLNYRGGGELLEAFGVGLALPWWNAYLQCGRAVAPAYLLLGGNVFLSFASALASGLSDEESDRAGGKHTFTTRLGNAAVRRAAEASLLGGALAWIAAAPHALGHSPYVTALPPAAWIALQALLAHRLGAEATTNAFAAQGRYKEALHRGIWGGGALLALLLGLGAFTEA